jgi:hypothetical protein
MTYRAFADPVLLIALFVASGSPAGANPGDSGTVNWVPEPIRLGIQDVEKTHVVNLEDGSTVTGGHVGVALACTPCAQAFAKKVNADGTPAWLFTAHADRDCNGDGQPDGDGDPLFEDWTIFDPSFIFGSTTTSATFGPNGHVYYSGQMLVASTIGGIVQGAWGAFVLRFNAAGVLAGQAYFGAVPQGEPPDVASCEALCSALNDSTLEQNASGAIAYRPGSVAIGGWKRSPVPAGVGDKDVFVALLAENLAATSWTYDNSYAGSDEEVRAVAFDSGGDVYVTGYFDEERDGFAARLDGQTGVLTHVLTFAGPLDDEGTAIALEGPAPFEAVRLDGFFTDEVQIGAEHVTGEGVTTFTACLSKQMALESVVTPAAAGEPCAVGQAQPTSMRKVSVHKVSVHKASVHEASVHEASVHEASVHEASMSKVQSVENPSGPEVESSPFDVDVLAGQSGNCRPEHALQELNCVDLVAHSDDRYLHVYGEATEEPEGGDLMEIAFRIRLPASKPKLTEVSFELVSDYCSKIKLLLGGGNAPENTFFDLGEIDVCPLDEPVVAFEVSEEIAQGLGFWSELPQQPLTCKLRARLFGIACSTCDSLAKDSELDHFSAGSGDPEL